MQFAENKLAPKAGRLLVAEPFLDDGYFRRAVVLLVEHNEKGSLGFILNKPVDLRLNEAVQDFPEYAESLFLGGPVQRDQLFYVHTLGELIEDSWPIGEGLWWNGNFETIRDMVEAGVIRPNQLRFFIGYSGWEAQQLEREMSEKAWFVSPMSTDLIFSEKPDALWGETLKRMGKNYGVMANFPQDPSLN